MDIFNLIQSNLLTPIILFFLFGIIAARIKSDLKIPEAISEFLPIYLLAAIGLHGGIEMRKTGFEEMLIPMLVAIGLSLLFTLNHYQILKRLGKFNIFDSYALASTYGAVGAVTFSVGLSFLKNQGVTSEGYLAAILAVLEPAAFIMAIFLTNMAVSKQIRSKKQSFSKDDTSDIDIGMKETKTKLSQVLQESITGKAIVILLGSIVIGYIIGEEGFEPISIVFDELFTGAIVIFMIEMGIIAGQRLEDIKKVGIFLTSFAIIMPTFNGIIGVLVSTALGLSLGGAVMFGLLLASASFIAAPAVLRHAIPQANPKSLYYICIGNNIPIQHYCIIANHVYRLNMGSWRRSNRLIQLCYKGVHMKLYNVKLLTITCEILAQKNVIDILKNHNITGYTSYEVDGNGEKGLRGQGIQAEKNVKVEIIMREEKLSDVIEDISRTLFPDFTIILYVSDVGVVRTEKF